MRVLIYSENFNAIKKSGLGRATLHQKKALESVGVSYTTDVKGDYDVVHINTYGIKSKLLAKKAKRQGKMVIYHAHSTEEDFRNSFIGSNFFSKAFKKWICSCYRLGDVILTPTEYSKKLLDGYNLGRTVISISNGIDLSKYVPLDSDRKQFRDKYNLSDSDKVIISVGLFFQRKGILDFVRLAEKMPDYKFIWFGETPSFLIPRKIRTAVKTKLRNLLFAGYVEPTELKKAYVGCDLFFFPSYEETEGIVLLEAIASKANVLVRDIPAFGWLENKREVYKGTDNEEFERLIEDITSGRLPEIKMSGYEKLMERDINEIGKKLKEIYSDKTF